MKPLSLNYAIVVGLMNFLVSFLATVSLSAALIFSASKTKGDKMEFVFLIYLLGISLVLLIKDSFLLLGLKNENHLMLLPWLVIDGFTMIVLIFLNIAVIIRDWEKSGNLIILIIGGFLYHAKSIYCYMRMLLLYKQLRLSRGDQQKRNLVDM